jgi:hypothetical protein
MASSSRSFCARGKTKGGLAAAFLDLKQIVARFEPTANSFVMRGLDPRIHLSSKEGLPGQARQ